MTPRITALPPLGLLLLGALLLSACIGSPTANTLYTLQPARQPPLARDFKDFNEMILILPIRLAPTLQGRGLVRHGSPVESRTAVNHLWAGPLDEQIAATVAADLKELLATANIAVYPGPRFGASRYQVEIEINEFSGPEQAFTLAAVYTLSDSSARAILARKNFQQTRAIDKPDYSGYVETASQALGDLSREVAAALIASRHHPSPSTRKPTEPAEP